MENIGDHNLANHQYRPPIGARSLSIGHKIPLRNYSESFMQGTKGLLKMRLINGQGKDVFLNDHNQRKDIYKEKMKVLTESINKI